MVPRDLQLGRGAVARVVVACAAKPWAHTFPGPCGVCPAHVVGTPGDFVTEATAQVIEAVKRHGCGLGKGGAGGERKGRGGRWA